jgi:hypothetical protein
VSLVSLRMFACSVEIAGTSYLEVSFVLSRIPSLSRVLEPTARSVSSTCLLAQADYRLECSGAEYNANFSWAVLMTALLPIGFPCGLLTFLLLNRSRLDKDTYINTVGFLYRSVCR